MAITVLIVLFSAPGVFAEDELRIYTVNYPLAYFAERIVGDAAVELAHQRGEDGGAPDVVVEAHAAIVSRLAMARRSGP